MLLQFAAALGAGIVPEMDFDEAKKHQGVESPVKVGEGASGEKLMALKNVLNGGASIPEKDQAENSGNHGEVVFCFHWGFKLSIGLGPVLHGFSWNGLCRRALPDMESGTLLKAGDGFKFCFQPALDGNLPLDHENKGVGFFGGLIDEGF